MQKILEDYLKNYINFGNRNQKLNQNIEYTQIFNNIIHLEKKIIKKLLMNIDEDEANELIKELDNLFWKRSDITEKDAFELGFYTGLNIGIESYNAAKKI